MSDIVLTAAVRQNLLSLQGTAELLSTTQTRLATGKKVNSALDNPTNFFTAAGLDARASDIGNLLDSIGNGVQVLQAADTGITSLQKLVDTAKSIANQALQQPTGYSTKSSIAFTGTGTGVAPAGPATAADLTTSKLNGGVYTFTNSAGTAVTITVGTAASAFGANLSIVQIRQDFSKNLINVLQTGSSNLTLADSNEEAANSQALSTRQSIAVSALSLANQSNQSVLQLLR